MTRIIVLSMFLTALLLFGCIQQQSPQAPTQEKISINGTGQKPVLEEGLDVGNTALNFELKDPEKGLVSRSSFRGKPVMIFFTTTWCASCQIGAQQLAKYDDETGGNAFNVLVVFVDDKETDSQFVEWRKNFGRSDWFVAKGIEMARDYRVQYLDTKYVLDKNGVIKWVDTRPLDYASAKSVLQPILK